jgi:hypothetical protein
MSRDRHLTDLEDLLSPKQRTQAWLDEAHTFATMPEYAASLVGRPNTEYPMYLVARRAAISAGRAVGSRSLNDFYEARMQAQRDGAFLVWLVLTVNDVTEERRRLDTLRWSTLNAMMRADIAEWTLAAPDTEERAVIEARWPEWRRAVAQLALDVLIEEEARSVLSDRYLDGRDMPFPEAITALGDLRQNVEDLALLAARLSHPGGPRVEGPEEAEDKSLVLEPGPMREMAQRAAVARAEYIADLARFRTVDFLGGEQAESYLLRYIESRGASRQSQRTSASGHY